ADWRRGETERARHWYDAAEFWMAKYDRDNHDLARFRAELQTLLSAPHDSLPAHIDDAAIAQALCAADPGLECYWNIKGRVDAAIRDWKWEDATADVLRAAAQKPEDD